MNLADYEVWFSTFVTTILNHPLPPLPEDISHPLPPIPDDISDTSSDSGYWSSTSILPPIIYKNKIFEKILKDLLRLIIQYFIDLLTSIITSKAKSALLSVGLFGLFKITNNNKGKAKEENSTSDSESFIQWPSEASDTQSINSASSSEVELDSEVESALEREIEFERRIQAESRKSFLQEFINKAKIAPTKELQYEMFKILFEIEKEKREKSDQDISSSPQPKLRRTKPKWEARESTTSTLLDLGTIQREELDQDNLTSSRPTSSATIYPTIPRETMKELLIAIEIRRRRKEKGKARLPTASTELDLDTIQRLATEPLITPSVSTNTKVDYISEEEMHRLRKSWPFLVELHLLYYFLYFQISLKSLY